MNDLAARVRRCRMVRGLSASVVVSAVAFGAIAPASADDRPKPPKGVVEVPAPEPPEISGVAAVPGGYAVVGDDTNDHGRIWPSGGRWFIDPPVTGPESLDVGVGPQGAPLWLILGEDKRTLADLSGGRYVFPDAYREVCGRGLEGLAEVLSLGLEDALRAGCRLGA